MDGGRPLARYFVIKFTRPAVVRSAATWGDAAGPAAEAEEAAHRVLSPRHATDGERPLSAATFPTPQVTCASRAPTPALRRKALGGAGGPWL